MKDYNDYVGIREFAKITGIHRATVSWRVQHGLIPTEIINVPHKMIHKSWIEKIDKTDLRRKKDDDTVDN